MILFSHFSLLRQPLSGPATLLLAVALGAAHPAQAQREVRHLNAVSAQYGGTSNGVYYQASYARYISDKTRFEVAAALEQGPRENAPGESSTPRYRGYELGIGLAPRLFRIGEAFYVRLPFQLRTRYERRPPTGPADKDGFTVGPSVGFAADLYLWDRLSLCGEFRQNWYPVGSPVNSLPRYFGGGLSLHIGK